MIKLPKSPGFTLAGKRALVTGAGRGLGLAAAAALAECGADVVLAARTETEICDVAEAIRAEGGTATPLTIDVTNFAECSSAIAEMGPFDILINNAGTNRPNPIGDVSEEDYDVVLGLNLKATYFVAQAVVKGMMETKIKGSLIHLSSQLGHVGLANRSLYCASKWAIEGMSKSLALELAPNGIRSNTIAPTFIETPLTKPFLADDAFRKNVLSKIKLGRIGKVEDVMGAIQYLASDASALVTGTSLLVDGGWTAD